MPSLSLRAKIAIVAALLFVLVVLGFFFIVPTPHVSLPTNYGGDAGEPFAKLGPIFISNTMIAAWIGIALLVLLFYLATRKMKLVPRGIQNVMEAVVEALANFVEGVAGRENGRRFFPIIATIFLFVVVNAWISLVPGFLTIGFGEVEEFEGALFGSGESFIVEVPFLRGANTDINVPLALALFSFLFVEYWGATTIGVRHYASKFFRFGQLIGGLGQLIRGRIKSAVGTLFFGVVDVFVGFLEMLSEFVRIISFTFRLLGNMTAGEVLVTMVAFLIPWVAVVPFYGLELLLGFIQALIFAGLTLVFATVAVTPHEVRHEEES